MIQDRVVRTVACDREGCAHADTPFQFWTDQIAQTILPDWVQNVRMVLVDNKSPQGLRFVYCSKTCLSQDALAGKHEPVPEKTITLATEADVKPVAALAAETEQLKENTPAAAADASELVEKTRRTRKGAIAI